MSRCTSVIEFTTGNASNAPQVITMRCAKRPHTMGLHVGLYPEGARDVRYTFWREDGSTPSQAEVSDEDVRRKPLEITHLAMPAPAERRAGPRAQRRTERETAFDRARAKGYSGDTCSDCGSMDVVPNGTCKKCLSCGSTTGCS